MKNYELKVNPSTTHSGSKSNSFDLSIPVQGRIAQKKDSGSGPSEAGGGHSGARREEEGDAVDGV